MSTRGTYLIRVRKEWEHITQCFYIHSDNYPKGAAMHLQEALDLNWKYQVSGKNMAKRFASIDGSEFTASHEEHDDTEYRYNITQTQKETYIEAIKCTGWVNNEKEWKTFFTGPLKEFIAMYGEMKNENQT